MFAIFVRHGGRSQPTIGAPSMFAIFVRRGGGSLSRRRLGTRAQGPDPGSTRAKSTFIGTTVGSALLVVSGTVFLWPAGDMFLGPYLIKRSILGTLPTNPAEKIGIKGTVVVEASLEGSGRALAKRCADDQRPFVYISLREATSSHDLLFAVIEGVYSHGSLGLIGNVARSMGLWWVVLFDIIVGHDPAYTRAVHFSIVLSHLKRGLSMANEASGQRPIVIIDHFAPTLMLMNEGTPNAAGCGDSNATAESRAVRQMLLHLEAWCSSVAFDLNIGDVQLFADPELARKSLSSDWRSRWTWTWTIWKCGVDATTTQCYYESAPFHRRIRRMLG